MYPLNLILIRHGESEGNLAKFKALSENNNELYEKLESRKNPFYRLTQNGREQIEYTSRWLKENIKFKIDNFYSSEYIRALETALLLDIEYAHWEIKTYLREKDNGMLSGLSPDFKTENYSQEIKRKEDSLFYYAAPGGESVINCINRAESFLNSTINKTTDKTITPTEKSILCVCHGGIMNSFRLLIENIRGTDINKIKKMLSGDEQIYNGQILWFSRKNPFTNKINPNYKWLYTICPWKIKTINYDLKDWTEIKPKLYNNDELEDIINQIEPIQ